MEAVKMPIIDEWIKKMWYLYTMGFYVKLTRLRKPKAAYFLSFIEYRPNTNTSNGMKNRSC
jgi:hypothetical protein